MELRSFGVEEEFLVLRQLGTRLAEDGERIAASASAGATGAQFEHELKQAQVELGSSPTTDVSVLRHDLAALRRELASAARRRGARLVASGTSPRLEAAHVTDEQRYREMTDRFGLVARQQLTCGMHIHVSVASPDEGIHVVDALAPHLAVLTALSANSPFYGDQDTGYASYRAVLWGTWPTAGPTYGFGDLAAYRQLTADLVELGAARDEKMIYFDARLSSRYPTVEIRVCDVCPTVDDAATIAALARALVDHVAGADPMAPVRPELLRAAAWRAARDGTGDRLVDLTADRPRLRPAWELVDDLVERLADPLGRAGDAALVRDGLARIRQRGTGADLQRATLARAGSVEDVLDRMTLAG